MLPEKNKSFYLYVEREKITHILKEPHSPEVEFICCTDKKYHGCLSHLQNSKVFPNSSHTKIWSTQDLVLSNWIKTSEETRGIYECSVRERMASRKKGESPVLTRIHAKSGSTFLKGRKFHRAYPLPMQGYTYEPKSPTEG